MKPAYGLHKDHAGRVLAAQSFAEDYRCRAWLGSLSVEPGDMVEFFPLNERAEFDEVPPFIALHPPEFIGTNDVAGDDQPFDDQPF